MNVNSIPNLKMEVSDCLKQKHCQVDTLFSKKILCDCGSEVTNVFLYYRDYAKKEGNQIRAAFVKAYLEGKLVKEANSSVHDKNLWVCLNEECSFRKTPGKPLEVCFF
jgi:hypothetical protein